MTAGNHGFLKVVRMYRRVLIAVATDVCRLPWGAGAEFRRGVNANPDNETPNSTGAQAQTTAHYQYHHSRHALHTRSEQEKQEDRQPDCERRLQAAG